MYCGAWSFLVGELACPVYSNNERDFDKLIGPRQCQKRHLEGQESSRLGKSRQ